MSLIPCKECKKEISSTAPNCPNCGVQHPGMYGSGKVIIHRSNIFLNALQPMSFYFNGQKLTTLAVGETVSIEIPAGVYSVQAKLLLTGYSDKHTVKIHLGEICSLSASINLDFQGTPKIENISYE